MTYEQYHIIFKNQVSVKAVAFKFILIGKKKDLKKIATIMINHKSLNITNIRAIYISTNLLKKKIHQF